MKKYALILVLFFIAINNLFAIELPNNNDKIKLNDLPSINKPNTKKIVLIRELQQYSEVSFKRFVLFGKEGKLESVYTDYLPLTGGTLTGGITVQADQGLTVLSTNPYISFNTLSGGLWAIGRNTGGAIGDNFGIYSYANGVIAEFSSSSNKGTTLHGVLNGTSATFSDNLAIGGATFGGSSGVSGKGIAFPSTTNDFQWVYGEHDGNDKSNLIFHQGDNADDGVIFRNSDCCGTGTLDYMKISREKLFYIGGYVGIGTTSPISPASIVGVNASTLTLTRQNVGAIAGNTASAIDFRIDQGSANGATGESLLARVESAPQDGWGGHLIFYTKINNGNPNSSLSERMRITPNGNVGIGTSIPQGYLDVGNTNSGLSSVLGRLAEGNTSGDGTFLGIKTYNTQGAGDVKSFALEHHFYGQINNTINFYRGGDTKGGFMTFATNDGTEKMRITSNGNVGIGTTNPGAKLEVSGQARLCWGNVTGGGISIYDDGNAHIERATAGPLRIASDNASDIYLAQGGGNLIWGSSYSQGISQAGDLTFKNAYFSGNVGIGTANPSEKLSVNGNIRAKKLTVTQQNFPDYVFDTTYQLQSLSQVEQFIKTNKHLPDVPSAKQVEKDGIDVGDNQALLLKKIEELTLYMIEIKKENEQMKKENKTLIERIEKLENK